MTDFWVVEPELRLAHDLRNIATRAIGIDYGIGTGAEVAQALKELAEELEVLTHNRRKEVEEHLNHATSELDKIDTDNNRIEHNLTYLVGAITAVTEALRVALTEADAS